jgi:uncharacterized protein (TIGR01777 family)
MNILIAGGSGFIGQQLTRAFVGQGHQVAILTRTEKNSPSSQISFHAWSGRAIPAGLGPFEVIINLTGASIAGARWTKAYKKKIIDSRVEATKACVEYMQASPQPPRVFLNASAVGIYGGNREEETDEFSRLGKDFMAEVCKKWEMAAKQAPCRTVLLRIAVVLGKEDGALPILTKVYNAYLGARFGNGQQGYSWIHIKDLVRAVQFLIETEDITGPVNLVAPQVMNQKRFSYILSKVLQKPDFWVIPKFALKLIFAERSILFWGGQRAIPRRLQIARFTFDFPSLRPALDDLLKPGTASNG